MRLYTRSEHYSPRVEGSSPVRASSFAEFIVLYYSGIDATMIYFRETSTVHWVFPILNEKIDSFRTISWQFFLKKKRNTEKAFIDLQSCLANSSLIYLIKQESIPVGCVPSAAVVICWRGGCLPNGLSAGGCLPWGGVCPGGVSAQGVSTWGGLAGGGSGRHPPWTEWRTDRRKNITLPCGRQQI